MEKDALLQFSGNRSVPFVGGLKSLQFSGGVGFVGPLVSNPDRSSQHHGTAPVRKFHYAQEFS
jgi:hypothetical protein